MVKKQEEVQSHVTEAYVLAGSRCQDGGKHGLDPWLSHGPCLLLLSTSRSMVCDFGRKLDFFQRFFDGEVDSVSWFWQRQSACSTSVDEKTADDGVVHA